ncbi:MAG: hypothetical protein OEV42_13910 [Deltaproteobacteria bacterium]|nr:hypothetical protein [Deltaproteobacteria bacterium]
MKKIIMLGMTGIFLAVFILVMQGKEGAGLDMSELFNEERSAVNSGPEKKISAVNIKKPAKVKAEIKKTVQTRPAEKRHLLRNDAIRKALKIEPVERAKGEVKKILAEYGHNDNGRPVYRRSNDDSNRATYNGRPEKRYGHNDEEDDDD